MDRQLPADLEVFDRRAAPAVQAPYITIQASGTITVNRASAEVLGLPEAVELAFSREERLIVLRPVELSSPRAYPLRKQGRSSNYVIGGKAFCDYYGISLGTAKRYAAEHIGNNMLAVDLKQEAARPARAKRQSQDKG